jgi:hypothetical protein
MTGVFVDGIHVTIYIAAPLGSVMAYGDSTFNRRCSFSGVGSLGNFSNRIVHFGAFVVPWGSFRVIYPNPMVIYKSCLESWWVFPFPEDYRIEDMSDMFCSFCRIQCQMHGEMTKKDTKILGHLGS